MFGDNQSVVTSSTFPYSDLKKRCQILCYHRVREAIAAGILAFYFLRGEDNPADLLSKHWGYQAAWPLMKPLLFWKGDTMDINDGVAVKIPPHDRTKGEYNEVGHINGTSVARHIKRD